MLSSNDIADLAMAICATAETLGQTISAGAAKIMAEDLACFEEQVIGDALRACRRELTGKLTLAAILQRIQAADGRPGKDEAWSIALASNDEFDTVVMTEEIMQAMTSARPILNAGDKVGARMAFLSTYERLVDDARKQGIPVKWSISYGFDSQRRLAAIEEAARLKRIPPQIAQEHVARLTYEQPTNDGKAIAGLLTGTVVQPSMDIRCKIDELKANIKKSSDQKKAELNRQREAITIDLQERQAKAQAALAALKEKQA
ncbi:hypothetical protein [Pseudomonas sp.]|uniref:hypothetical protein n=1 Tax=Pseudomonas sp. TaxID=306 RepID=UPI0028996D9A|nr:hypothetical protein [Pseudomonas sp.]